MGDTLTALQSQSGVRLDYTAIIEGFPNILCSGDPQAAYDAYQASDGYSSFAVAYGGLSVHWEMDQKIAPFQPFPDPSMIKLCVVPATGYNGAAIALSDTIGEAVFKRTGGTETGIATAIDNNDTSLVVQRADDFAAAPGTLYVGPEAMAYSAKDNGTDTFTISTRGKWSTFRTGAELNFARMHKPLTSSEQDIGIPPVVSSEPRTWIGRYVAVWIHRNVAGTLDPPNADASGAHLGFAGQIVEVEDAGGATWFTVSDVRRSIYGTRLNRNQFRARAAEGVWIATGTTFNVATARITSGGGTTATGNALTAVASGASGTNQMNEGRYTAAELGNILNAWLQGERAATRILFNVTYNPLFEDNGATRGRLGYHDPTAAALARQIDITCSLAWPCIFLGWPAGAISGGGFAQSGETLSQNVPLRFMMQDDPVGTQTLNLTEPRGSWIIQTTLLPQALRDATNTIEGILKVGDIGYVRARRTSDTQFQITEDGLGSFFPGSVDGSFNSVRYTVDEDVNLDVRQVLVIDTPFKNLLLQVLLSTGTSGFNHATYDTLDENLGCAIPFSILGLGFVNEVGNLSCANTSCSAIIDGPISFHELFQADFILRRCALVWGSGRLNVKTWSTPTSTYATTTLTETTKATPSGTQDNQRAAVSESADFYNIVRIHHNIDADGKYHDILTLKDAVSIRAYGERSIEVKARNSFRQVGAIGSQLDELISIFAGFFGYTSRPWQVITRSIDFSKFESCIPGTTVTLTDKYVRDPSTGRRYNNTTATGGLSGYPGLVIGQEYTYGTAEAGRDGSSSTVSTFGGQVQVMISPQRTIAPYVFCAQVDDTAANAGYNAGTKVLTCYAHEHSESADVADATRFVAGDEVLVVEMDPTTAASPLSWSDVVASQSGNTITLTTGLAGWDTTKKYRVIYDAYGTVGTSQKAYCYQADDADGLIVDTAQAYAYGYFGVAQAGAVTSSTGTEVPSRHATLAYGDGKPLDVGYERDAVRLANNLVNYKTAFQSPTAWTEVRNFTGGGTMQLVEIFPVYMGIGGLTAGLTRLISLAPRMRSTDGNTASVRVTYSPRRPTGTTRDDVTRVWPYVSVTFTTTTTANFVIPSVSTIDFARGNMADTNLGGVNWIYVESNNKAEYSGLGRFRLGALA